MSYELVHTLRGYVLRIKSNIFLKLLVSCTIFPRNLLICNKTENSLRIQYATDNPRVPGRG